MESHVSPFNKPLERTKPLIFCDVTLREGEQTPGVNFTLEEKMQLAHLLDEVGVGQIQIAHPKLNKRTLAVCRSVCDMPRHFKAEIMTNGMWEGIFEGIDRAAECGPDIIHTYFPASGYQMRGWDDSGKAALLERMKRVIAHIKSKGVICNVSFLDGTRATDLDFFRLQLQTAVDAGANRIRVPDTVGVCDPDGYYKVVRTALDIAEPRSVLVGIHTHNDFGLALANTLAGIRAGADMVDVTVNGLGDRAGNVALAELAVLLEGFYGFRTGIDVGRMKEVSAFAEKIAGQKLPGNKPLVGENVFSDESELHNLCMNENPYAYQAILPSFFGASRRSIFGKLTTDKVLDMVCKRAGKTIDPKYYPQILDELYVYSDTHKGVVIDEAMLWEIAERIAASEGK